jgi:hypothetical protein
MDQFLGAGQFLNGLCNFGSAFIPDKQNLNNKGLGNFAH